ncbi:HVO_0476 family zinc finger protein [Halorussus caseinilyticus]|uniref:HVO_0476 family zinc finger protein n=1 Tax=Halorussus caseinilyticus TaxID=3034025 RepID=A0ABD5WP26_9EURY|nr:HVO_0476 family zinc finger protein [Halorussus sp. DT72]
MSETAERVAVTCPSCSPDVETVHEVLKEGSGQFTVRCTECSHVHKTAIEREEDVERDVIVSQDGESFTATADAPPEETVAVGEEFVLETPEAIMVVRITDLQLGDEKRTDEAKVEDVETFWTRAVDNVRVNVTINPTDGRRDDSRGVKIDVPGDYEFEVGEVEEFGDEKFEVKSIAVRDDATGYDFNPLGEKGDTAVAKDVKRVYGDDETSSAWSAW